MSQSKDGAMPHVEVPDAAAAFHKLEDAARRLLSVPKKDVSAARRAKPDTNRKKPKA